MTIQHARKKELVREYRERKALPGIIEIRCTVGGDAWIGAARDTARAKNGIWFQLRMGNHMNRALQAAWQSHGEGAFVFDVLENVEDENPQMIDLLLKDREAHWRAARNAAPLFA